MEITLSIKRSAAQPQSDEVLVEGSWFPRAALPDILGNHIRTANRYGRDLKEAYAKVEDLQRSLAELAPTKRKQCSPDSPCDECAAAIGGA